MRHLPSVGVVMAASMLTASVFAQHELDLAPPPVPPLDGRLRVQVDGAPDGPVTLYRLSSDAVHPQPMTICTAPCLAALAPGTYRFAVALGAEPPLAAEPSALTLTGAESVLLARYDSAQGTRTTGVVISSVGLLGSVGFLGAAFFTREDQQPLSTPLLISAAGLAVASIVTGLILNAIPDHAEVTTR